MISLVAVEELVSKIDNCQSMHAAICVPDDKKGEQILLFTTIKDLTREQIAKEAKEMAVSELYIPKIIVVIIEIPLLASGKTDYLKISELAKEYV